MKKIVMLVMMMFVFPLLTKASIKVDGVSCSTIEAATSRIHDDSVIVFESDYNTNSTDFNNYNILTIVYNNVTVDLNGHSIDMIIVNQNITNVRIKNGTISGKLGGVLVVDKNSTAYINNVSFNVQSCGSSNYCGSSDPDEGIPNNAIVNSGNLSIEDCKFTYNNTILNESGAEMSIRQSIFTTNPSSIKNDGTLIIEGTTKSTGTLNLYALGNNYNFNANATITVDGITCINPFAASDLIKDGSTVVFNGNYRNTTTNNADYLHVLVISNRNVSVNLNNYNIDSIWIVNDATGVTIQNGTIFNSHGYALVVGENSSVSLSNIDIGARSCGKEKCGDDLQVNNNVIHNYGTINVTSGILAFDNSILNESGATLTFNSVKTLYNPSIINNSGSVSIDGTAKSGTSIDLFTMVPTYLGDWNNNGSLDGQDVIICRTYLSNNALIKTQYPDVEKHRRLIVDIKRDNIINLVDLVKLRLEVANSVQ